MYRITCDGYALLDTRDESLIVKSPKVKLSDNTVGEASFTIYKQHPYYDRLGMLKSVFEISDEYGVIFRGRMTEHTRDIKKGKAIDLEGAMSYFNDSIVRPYVFPDDWEDENHPEHSSYVAAKTSGNVVAYYLAWLIAQHNAQVDDFQQFKLGTVTVTDPNNHLERADSEYPNTFEEIKAKLFTSSLGGHLCIRYEADGNYIDYLAEFTEVNPQGITYGENLRDITQTTDGKGTYSAIIPRGAEIESEESTGDDYEGMYGTIVGTETVKKRLTLADHPDGDITSDIVKRGDVLYSKRAVAAYGWRYVPAPDSVWDDVKEIENLLDRGVDVLEGTITNIPNTIECKAVDLHCTDAQIRSFRMYKKIPVYVAPHDINDVFDITTLDIDLLNPQNTNIVAGKTVLTMTELQEKRTNEVKQLLGSLVTRTQFAEGFKVTESLIEKNNDNILLRVSSTYATKDALGNYATTQSVKNEISTSLDGINLSIYSIEEKLGDCATTEYVDGSLALKIVEKKDDDGNVVERYSQLAADVDKIRFVAGQFELDTPDLKLDSTGLESVGEDEFGWYENRIIAKQGRLIVSSVPTSANRTVNTFSSSVSGAGMKINHWSANGSYEYFDIMFAGAGSAITIDPIVQIGGTKVTTEMIGSWCATPTTEGATSDRSPVVTMADLKALGLI